MSRNLKYQFATSINGAFSPNGIDKHSIKSSGENKLQHVYSYKERANLIDTSAQIGDFVRKNYPDVKLVANITPTMIQEFLNTKAKNCSQQTLGQYTSRINKLESLVNKAFRIDVRWKSEIVTPCSSVQGKIRNVVMSREDLEKILDFGRQKGSRSQAPIAIEMAGRFGMRVTETTKFQPRDVKWDTQELHIHESKGRKNRDITISKDDMIFLQKITDGKNATERIVQIEEDSVNRYLQRIQEKLNIRQKYKDAKSGVHSIRKMRAQEIFDMYRYKYGIRQALDETSKYLGHGKDRMAVLKEYVLRIY